METNTLITFTAPKDGKLILVTYSTNSNPSITVNDKTYRSANVATEIELDGGTDYKIGKGTTNIYFYYLRFIEE